MGRGWLTGLLLWGASGSAWAFPAEVAGPCGTLGRLQHTLQAAPVRLPLPPPGTEKAEREAGGTCANSEASDNFVLKWGNEESVSAYAVTEMLSAFEFTWSELVTQMGHPPPLTSATYKFNIYVGDTGSCAPSAYGNGGYFTVDAEGYPFIVMSLGTMADTTYGKSVAAHEFYHAVQHATEAYGAGTYAQWYWEATATWAEREVYISDTVYAQFLFGYAFMPYRQLNAYQYPGTGAIEEFHQYGAFIFPRYLSEHVEDWTLIRDSWVLADWNDDPIRVLEDLLPGGDIEAIFGDFAAQNATWDYLDGSLYEQVLDQTADQSAYGIYDSRIVDTVGSQGTGDEWVEGPSLTLPERFGYNIIRLKSPESRELTVRFEGDESGSEGSTARYQVRLVREYGTSRAYELVELDGTSGELSVGKVGTEAALYLAVSAFADHWNEGESFAYRYQLDMGEVDQPGVDTSNGGSMPQALHVANDEEGGCACAQGASPAGGWLAGLGLMLVGLRRRAAPAAGSVQAR
jgi:hypothetical protein